MKHRVFMDTAFLIAVLDESDKYHHVAVDSYKKLINEKREIITTDAILVEIGNGLSKPRWRDTAHKWITQIRKNPQIFDVVSTGPEILDKAIELYGSRSDKEWGLTDCISSIVMRELKLSHALTLDHHFEQAGFEISMMI